MESISQYLKFMVENDASDIYLTTGVPPSFRIEGIVSPALNTKPLIPEDTERIAFDIMNDRQRKKFEEELEMNLAIYSPQYGRFRINIFRQKNFTGIIIRQIKLFIKSIDDWGLPSVMKDIALTKRGLVLVVGAAGSGKSTTLAALINHRNENEYGHIVTIEDPIEFVHEHKKSVITQREVGLDTHSFINALKNTLRQSPDVILIGKVRDAETMEDAVTFADTGHLCLTTLHANNANQALDRVLNFFPAERHLQLFMQLSLNLKAIISQRLIPTIEGKRVAAIEILLNSPRIQDLIMKGNVSMIKETMAASHTEGMQTFDQHIFDLYKAGIINYDNAMAYSDSPGDLRLRIKMSEVDKGGKETFFKLRKDQK